MLRTNPASFRSCVCVPFFRLNFASDFFNLLLAGFHHAEIIIMKPLIQGRNNETRLGVEPLTLRSWSSTDANVEKSRYIVIGKNRYRYITNTNILLYIFILLCIFFSFISIFEHSSSSVFYFRTVNTIKEYDKSKEI